ncbi:ubiquitin family protein [Thraustotheca clavata]|uniref:Ubiquitin family protein n=1 Tax=Thraustotheca clavata TaxID=74557 RepID=A0A1W0A2M1_9STRA|nr:ubiquitin family protein [Thraustotheca clavata]
MTNEGDPMGHEGGSGRVRGDNPSENIDLNVKTLDHRVFRVNLLASSSVPQLKRKIEAETGVVCDRQRLIFRGKVLKNENDLAFYALEDGHTLHLVIRPLEAEETSGNTTVLPNVAPRMAAPAPSPVNSQSNDEPDPSLLNPMGNLPINRVLMGATITVPEGQRGVPFLHSILSNIMSSVQGLNEENTPRQQRENNNEAPRPRPRPFGSALERAVRRAGGRSRMARLESTLRTIAEYLDNEEYVYPNNLNTRSTEYNDPDLETLRQHLSTFTELMQRFQPRIEQLPAALRQIETLRNNTNAQTPFVVPTMRTMDILQAFGDLCKLLSILSRRLLLRYRQHEGLEPSTSEELDLRALAQEARRNAVQGSSPPIPQERTQPTRTTNMEASRGENDQVNIVQAQIPLSPSLFQQIQESLPEGTDPEHFEFEAMIPIWQVVSGLNSTDATPAQAPTVPVRPPEPRWDFEGFVSFLINDIPAGELYGLLAGQHPSLHSILRRIGTRMLEGVNMPPMAPGSNREWSTRFINALRDYVACLPRVPSNVFRPNVLSELVERISPFAPEFIHLCIRATTVTTQASHNSAIAFMDSVVEFVGHMTSQFVIDLRSLLVDSTTPTNIAIERILGLCGMHPSFALLLVNSLPNWAPSTRNEETSSGPEAKRARHV